MQLLYRAAQELLLGAELGHRSLGRAVDRLRLRVHALELANDASLHAEVEKLKADLADGVPAKTVTVDELHSRYGH